MSGLADGQDGSAEFDAFEAERQHYMEVRASFVHYIDVEMPAYHRAVAHLAKLPADLRERLPPQTASRLERFKTAIEVNQQFLDNVVQHLDQQSMFPVPDQMRDLKGWRRTMAEYSRTGGPDPHLVLPHNASKVRSTLHQCIRDWSAEGAKEREECYGPIITELQKRLPLTDANINNVRVLVPGAGLGRLVLDIAVLGYGAEGNEFSYQMLFASNYMLNATHTGCDTVHPYIDTTCNHVKADDMVKPIPIPDVETRSMLQNVLAKLPDGEVHDFSMSAGEWMEVYSDQEATWDCVVTCFFLDTAPVVMQYIAAIQRLLKPGGLWINLGPLLYHWANSSGADDRYNISVELSWEEVSHVIRTYGFNILSEEFRDCCYNRDPRSMLYSAYRAVFMVAQKPADNRVKAGVNTEVNTESDCDH